MNENNVENRIETEVYYQHFQTLRKASTHAEIRNSSETMLIYTSMHYMTVMWKSLPQRAYKSWARAKYFCENLRKLALWLSVVPPHDGKRCCHWTTVLSTSHLLAALMRVPTDIQARMKNTWSTYAFLCSMFFLAMKKKIPLHTAVLCFLFGDTKLKIKHAIPNPVCL